MNNRNGCRRFVERVAIVTGASREPSIGRSTAARLAAEGASVVVNARTEGPLRDAEAVPRADLTPLGVRVNAVAPGLTRTTADGLRPAGSRS